MAHFFGAEELTELLKTMEFNAFSYYQTIFTLPNKMNSIEKPQRGYGRGSFVVMRAEKSLESN